MALSPDQWLDRLAKAMDDRSARLSLLRRYRDGDAPLPEGAEDCREAYRDFQRKARTNFGELVTDAVAERMIVGGFRVAGAPEDDDVARQIWLRSRMQAGSNDVHRDMVGLSSGYVMLGGDRGRATITVERPEQVITEHDARRPDIVRAAAKVYRDTLNGADVALLHLPGELYIFKRPLRDMLTNAPLNHIRAQGGWRVDDAEETGLSFVPVYPFVNRGGLGEFETHVDVLDRINWGILQRLVVTAMQAYRQRGIKGDLPPEDADGKEINYDEVFSPAPGALWQLPEGIDIWESQQTDITPLLSGVKDDIAHLAAVTRTPMSTLLPGGENQTAEGAAFAKEGLVFKAEDRQSRANWGDVMAGAMAIERGESEPVEGVEVTWKPAARPSLAERADAASKAQDLPWRTKMEEIWGFDGETIDRMESQRASDALLLGLSAPQAPQQAPQVPGNVPTP